MKVILSEGCKEIDGLTGRRYRAKNGVADVDPADAKGVVAIGGAICSLAGTTRRTIGYTCTGCGFGSFFVKCSRCGGEAVKETR